MNELQLTKPEPSGAIFAPTLLVPALAPALQAVNRGAHARQPRLCRVCETVECVRSGCLARCRSALTKI